MKTQTIYQHLLLVLMLAFVPLSVFSQKELKKSEMHRLLFPDTEGLMVFLAEPSFDGAYGFSIHENEGAYTLTVKQISNWREVNEQLEKDFPLQSIKKGTPPEERKLIAEKNKKQRIARKEAAAKIYNIESNTFNTNPELANQLILSCIDVISTYKNPVQKKRTKYINGDTITYVNMVMDGTSYTFYCRDKDSVYTRKVHEAYLDVKTTELKKMAEQIVNDSILNETELIKQLSALRKKRSKNGPAETNWEDIAQSPVLLSFLVEPAFDSPYGFCLTEKKDEHFLITKIIDNWEEVNKQMEAEFPMSSINIVELRTISRAEKDRRGAFNKIQRQKRAEKALTLYNEAIKEYPIDKEEAKELYLRFESFIDQYKKTDLPKKDVVSDGDTIVLTFDDGFGVTISYTKDNSTKSVSEREISLSEGFKEIYDHCTKILKEL